MEECVEMDFMNLVRLVPKQTKRVGTTLKPTIAACQTMREIHIVENYMEVFLKIESSYLQNSVHLFRFLVGKWFKALFTSFLRRDASSQAHRWKATSTSSPFVSPLQSPIPAAP